MPLATDATMNKLSYADERLDALLSITGRMDGYLYRCRNDQSYTMLYISDGIATISGYPPGDFIQNKVLEYVSVIHPDDLEAVYAAVNTALEAKRNWNVDYRIVPNFGRAVWVREIGGGVFNDAGELVFLEGFVVDIGDRKLIEDQNTRLLTQLKDVNELLSAQKRELQLAKQKSDHSANHDLLTGLPNRRAFHNQLKLAMDESRSTNTPVGLLFIDLDRFKEVNDTLGHESGDALLQHVSAQLQTLLRSTDFVARLGGDEFAFLLFGDPELTRETAAAWWRSVLWKNCGSMFLRRQGLSGSAARLALPCIRQMPHDPKGLLALADRLMYVGKKSGRNRLVTVNELEAA